MMEDYCAFIKDHKYLKWEHYELTRHELEEADRLCHTTATGSKFRGCMHTLTSSDPSWRKTISIIRKSDDP